MKALVTGSNGLLGSAIRNRIGQDHLFHNKQMADLTNKSEVDMLFETAKAFNCDTLIHCAAIVGGVQANMNGNDRFFIDNIIMDNNVMIKAFKNEYKTVITILSTCIFPEKADYPLTLNQIDNGEPHDSNKGYSYAKKSLYYNTKIYGQMTKNRWISIIPTNLFGINDLFNPTNSHIIPALIQKAYNAKKNNTDFVVWGDGTPLRQFVFSEDMADIILWAMDNWISNEPIIAVNEREYSIKEIAFLIAKILDLPENRIKFDISKPTGIFRKPAKSDIPNWNYTPIEIALEKTINWYKLNNHNLRS